MTQAEEMLQSGRVMWKATDETREGSDVGSEATENISSTTTLQLNSHSEFNQPVCRPFVLANRGLRFSPYPAPRVSLADLSVGTTSSAVSAIFRLIETCRSHVCPARKASICRLRHSRQAVPRRTSRQCYGSALLAGLVLVLRVSVRVLPGI